ncbi:MAG: putative toxin-antitoxin system toxin component, PIN family [Burkholderiaceae bacterium]
MTLETATDPSLPQAAASAVVIDTNLVLDLFVFRDAEVQALHAALEQRSVRWLATAAMRGELERVLGYPRVLPRLAPPGPSAHDVLAAFDRWATVVAPAAPAPVRCRDPDDQPFIDLAVAHGALLLSKDAQVLGTARRVALLGARVARHWPPA